MCVLCVSCRPHRSWDDPQWSHLVRQVLQVPDRIDATRNLVVSPGQVRVSVSVPPTDSRRRRRGGRRSSTCGSSTASGRPQRRERSECEIIDLDERPSDGLERLQDARVGSSRPHLIRRALQHIAEPEEARL
jgi:hypothetical protein